LKWVISYFLTNGTDKILKGNSTLYYDAMFVSFLEQWIAIHIEKTQASCHLIKIAELFKSDKHTLVSFFRKRIPCKCLDNNTKKSSPSQRWVCVAMKTAAMGRSNAARCWACLALDAEVQITVQENARRLHGHCTKNTARLMQVG